MGSASRKKVQALHQARDPSHSACTLLSNWACRADWAAQSWPGLPSPAAPASVALLQLLQEPRLAQEHAEGSELATSMHRLACGCAALLMVPHVVRRGLRAKGASHASPCGAMQALLQYQVCRLRCAQDVQECEAAVSVSHALVRHSCSALQALNGWPLEQYMTDQSGAALCIEVLVVVCSCRRTPHRSNSQRYPTLQTCCLASCWDAGFRSQISSLQLTERRTSCRQGQELPSFPHCNAFFAVNIWLPYTQRVLPFMAAMCMPAVNKGMMCCVEGKMACVSACAHGWLAHQDLEKGGLIFTATHFSETVFLRTWSMLQRVG